MDINTPAGRLVQGKLEMQQRKDTKTKQPIFKDAAKTIPDMGLFFSVAFPKVLPNGQPNTEFDTFFAGLRQVAATSWPQFFPQGPNGACTNPKFSWKYQDGDGIDTNGVSVAAKPGFKGHHVIKFDTNYPVGCYNEGEFRPDQQIGLAPSSPQPAQVIKRGYWVRVFAEAKSNNADLTLQQVPGISLYPKLVSFLGGRREDEISSGPDAMQALGQTGVAWRPDGLSVVPGAPIGAAGVPGVMPGLPVPTASIAAPVIPTYVVRPDLAAQGHTMVTLAQYGTPDQLVALGYVTVQAPVPVPTPGLPVPGTVGVGMPGLPAPGAIPGVVPGVVGGYVPAVPGVIPLPTPAAVAIPTPGPRYAVTPALAAQGVTMEALIAKGWDGPSLVAQGHAVLIG